MVNPISSTHSSQATEAAKSSASKPQPQPQKAAQPSDTVTLKSTGDAEHDGDSK
ncbi:MAG: hypothetical protein WCF22_02945 [Candidatus Sulfotelmatobacter sp.]